MNSIKRMVLLQVFFMAFFVITPTANAANAGYIAYINDRADIVVIETNYNTYTCAGIYNGGFLLQEGDRVIGQMDMFGMQKWNSRNGEMSVWVDEYMLSQDEVFEWLRRH